MARTTAGRFATAGALAVVTAGALIGPSAAAPEPEAVAAAEDACPGGWSTETTVWFGPPRIDTEIPNPGRDDGCTLLDRVWAEEPFATHGEFVGTVARATREFSDLGLLDAQQAATIRSAAARSAVGGPHDDSIPNTCTDRVALTFDDGPSFYRDQTLAILREKQVTATFFDAGMRIAANPQLPAFERLEGHLVLNHTWEHPNLNQVTIPRLRDEMRKTEEALDAAGVERPFLGMRPPFLAANASVRAELARLGFTVISGDIDAADWEPDRPAEQLRADIAEGIADGRRNIFLHDGPIDTVAGPELMKALPLIIDDIRAAGLCFGTFDSTGAIVADRYVSSGEPIPSVENAVPYLPLLFGGGLPPEPYEIIVPTPLGTASAAAAVAPAAADECPNGWSPRESVWFGPPRVETGVANPEGPDGCTLLDRVWAGEPFATHGEFVAAARAAADEFVASGELSRQDRARVVAAAARTHVGGPRDTSVPNTCDNRLAIQFDDGPSHFRTETLRILREKQVTGVFMDTGTRVLANPQFARFQLAEGHELLNHTFSHANLNQTLAAGGPDAVRKEILDAEAAFASVGAPISFKGIRPPFGSANAQVRQIIAELGYTAYMTRIGTDDWVPERTAQQISDAIVAQLRSGAIISLHDGPYDTPAGTGTNGGLALLIDAARELGYCFGTVDASGEVVADRLIPTGDPIPVVVNPVPYAPLVFPGEPPEPYVILS
ncbi:polysaccharide deacetylase family protein [Jiangella alkaliphila]|uniref:Peptidoglycan/xylan/chitin deacetylase, PgdA/CDA1 family n=1 Tax=Jiangella alkaliphila TaxID=419479 RepID=A0A1H2K8N9_9ACTN|nr:polysaccharide deacetylase family protein [Jiangella alkaliphila]SDU64716.1 Peptidoglycan/xylan/chitin deacetylase, PgdA/CDA1 family [Jiangella alkaliphila]